ncbi:MAG: hypothetical protein ACK5PQ_04160 [Alphaproteobacteria bacterium]
MVKKIIPLFMFLFICIEGPFQSSHAAANPRQQHEFVLDNATAALFRRMATEILGITYENPAQVLRDAEALLRRLGRQGNIKANIEHLQTMLMPVYNHADALDALGEPLDTALGTLSGALGTSHTLLQNINATKALIGVGGGSVVAELTALKTSLGEGESLAQSVQNVTTLVGTDEGSLITKLTNLNISMGPEASLQENLTRARSVAGAASGDTLVETLDEINGL